MARYCCDSVVRGYHVYKEAWEVSCGEMLSCARETGNAFDPFAVCVKKHGCTVGHMPRNISAICSLFLWRGGTIQCKVIGSRQYLHDLPQGRLEIPCQLIEGDSKYVHKVEKSINMNEKAKIPVKSTNTSSSAKDVKVEKEQDVPKVEKEQGVKKIRLDDTEGEEADTETNREWVHIFNITLKFSDRDLLSTGQELTDLLINAAQKLILHQFPMYQGLKNTLIKDSIGFWTNNYSTLPFLPLDNS